MEKENSGGMVVEGNSQRPRMDFFKAEMIQTDPSLMLELLNAATRTALAHRNDAHEMYVLGQLEATANIIYILTVSQGYEGLETTCQRMAQDALARMTEISGKMKSRDRDDESKMA